MEGKAFSRIHVLFLLLACTYTVAEVYQDPRDAFFNHAVVKPIVFPAVTSRVRPGSVQAQVENEWKMEFSAFEKKFDINLKVNKNLFSPKYEETYEEDGEEKVYQPISERERKCYYIGHVQNVEGSWAAVSTCDGISGAVYDGEETYYIEPDRLSSAGEHLVFKASDRKADISRCGLNEFSELSMRNIQFQEPSMKDKFLMVEENDSRMRYVEAYIINDNSMYVKYNRNLTSANNRAKQVVNGASALYSALNFSISIVKLTTWTTRNLFNVAQDSSINLANFLAYRKNKLLPAEPHDNALFLTATRFYRGVVGTARLSRMCTEGESGVQAVDSTPVVGEVAATYAHELGHNMGMRHDTDYCRCPPDRQCIMYYASTSVPPTRWSSCSKDQLNAFLQRGTANCLLNKPN